MTVQAGVTNDKRAFAPALPVIDTRFSDVRSVIVKVTTRCNLDCSYCFEHITKGADMELDTFRRLARLVISNSSSNHLRFIFHGGEPTLLSDDWFEEAINYARQLAFLQDKRVSFTVQSNIIRLQDSTLQLFRRLNVGLGASIDGPEDLPNQMRGRSNQAIANFKRASQAGVKCGILVTINHSNWSEVPRIMRWLEEEMGVRTVKANVMAAVGRGYNLQPLQADQVFEAHRAIVEYMINSNGIGVLEERNLREVLRFLDAEGGAETSTDGYLCSSRRCGAGKSVIAITPGGEILPCDRFQWDDTDYFLGNIAAHQDQTEFDTRVEEFHSLTPHVWIDCPSCPAAKMCSYGCQAYMARAQEKVNIECLPTKMKYAYFCENKDRLIRLRDALLTAGRLYEMDQVRDPYRDWGDDGMGS